MRLPTLLLALTACSSGPAPVRPELQPEPVATTPDPAAPATPSTPGVPAATWEKIATDTPRTTVVGNTFIAPAGWSLRVKGPATVLQAPEGDTWVALVDVKAKSADQAVELAWAAYGRAKQWPLEVVHQGADKDGWTKLASYAYTTSPNEKRGVWTGVRFANDTWTVVIYDLADAVADKRGSQVGLITGQLLPKGFERETFAGKPAHKLDKARIAALGTFVQAAQEQLGVPGVSIGIVQDGKVVFSGGFGPRELGKPAKVDGNTKYLIASNTKAMTTLMLAKLVDEKRLTWESTATGLLPSFKLGDADTTSKVMVKHLICACTGMPRQDMEWLLEYKALTPAGALATLATMQPTSKFGELFQYSNPLAAAAGFIGGHVAYPKLELGRAYDQAMQTRVFGPLGMTATTFDYRKAKRGNFAKAHSHDLQDKPAVAMDAINNSVIPLRPAGGAWSSVNDVLKYVAMELAEGKLPNGRQYIAKDTLLARRAPQVAIGKDTSYGMGLTVHDRFGVTVVNHGGDLIGFHSDMMWLPEHDVGAVVLTSGDAGQLIRGHFRRKLLEVLFDGNPEADRDLAAAAKNYFAGRVAERKQWTVPADATHVAKLAAKYAHPVLGEIAVTRTGDKTVFDFGEWKSEVGTKQYPDGSISFVTLVPGAQGFELIVGGTDAKRTLVLRDAQHEYVFDAK
ncbi:MAG: beta-lactamase family protein [Myxococcota bacterium]|nr:beta-lactamase family protein [Myxococcota bacterium]